jgi:hypothetical protein
MHSFQKLWQKIQENDNPHRESGSVKAIRNGIGIRSEFWDDFLALLNNSEAVADLLDVPVEKVSTWRSSIEKAIEKVHKTDQEVIPRDKKRLLKTGLPEEL